MNPVRATNLLTLMLILALAACGQEQGPEQAQEQQEQAEVQGPTQIVEAFFAALTAGDVTKAQGYVSAEAIGDDPAALAETLHFAAEGFSAGAAEAVVLSEEVEGDRAVVTAEATTLQNNHVQQGEVPLVLEDEEWRILPFW